MEITSSASSASATTQTETIEELHESEALELSQNIISRLHYESFAYQWVTDRLTKRFNALYITTEIVALFTALMGIITSLAPDAQLYGGVATAVLAIVTATALKINGRLYPASRFTKIRRYLDKVRKWLAKYKSLPDTMLADRIRKDYRKLQELLTSAPGLTVEQRKTTRELFEEFNA